LDLSDSISVAGLLNREAQIYISLDENEKALEQLEKELAIWKRWRIEERIAVTHQYLASVYRRLNDFEAAKTNLATTLAIQERLQGEGGEVHNLRTNAKAPSKEESRLPDIWRTYHDMARLMEATGRPLEAGQFYEKSKGAIETLRKGLITDETKIGFFQQTIKVYLDHVAFLVRGKRDDPARRQALEMTEQVRARALSDSLLRFESGTRSKRTFGETPSPNNVEPVTYQAVIDLARRDQTNYISYFAAGDAVYAWVINPLGQVMHFTLPVTRHQLESNIDRFRRGMKFRVSKAASQALFSDLITPLQPALSNLRPGDRVTFVPHESLNGIPFGALLDGERPWGFDYDITAVPSLSFAYYLESFTRDNADQILAIGKPAGSEGLHNSEGEVTAVYELFQAQHAGTLMLGEAANKHAVLTQAPKHHIILFSTHGRPANKAKDEFYLELAHGEKLTQRDIQSLDLRKAKLVALSACDTNVGRLHGGDELMSLARSFLLSGVDYVLVTLWEVDDRATSEIIVNFFSLLRSGIAPATALRRSQQRYYNSAKATPKLTNLFYWAPWVLIGRNG
jgi:CHAT domain-containing protein